MKKNMVLFITSFLLIFAVTNVYIYSNHKQYNAIEDISNLENTYLAFYSLEDNTSLSTMPGPRDGYTLDKDSSYCEVNGIKSNDMSIDLTLDWKIQIHGLTNSRTRCNLYFKKVINLTPFPDDVLAGVIDEEAGTGTPDDNGNGLYKVTPTLDGWTEPELRYAGPDPDNYVWFNCEAGTNSGDTNCEKWRIIGLVNVQTLTGIEQRLKIIRGQSIGNYSWDYKQSGVGSSDSEYGSNDWTDSQLMEKLNGKYYEGEVTDSGAKGLSEIARDMIDKEIIWNIGGWNTNQVETAEMYEHERGEKVYGERPTTWSSSNTKRPATAVGESSTKDSELFGSVGLMYPSDYGYASAGSSSEHGGKTRSQCVNDTVLYSYDSDSYCYERDWLYLGSYEWLLSPNSSHPYYAFNVGSSGYVGNGSYVYGSYAVRPVVYLTSNVKITDGYGAYDTPFILSGN